MDTFPAGKCAACPLGDRPGATCTAQARDHPAICGYVAEGNARWIARVLGGTAAAAVAPGPLTRAASLARAIVTHAVAGFPEAAEDVARARLATCRACPDLVASDPEKPSCNRCGCNLQIKVRWAGQACPAGKW